MAWRRLGDKPSSEPMVGGQPTVYALLGLSELSNTLLTRYGFDNTC